MTNYTKKRCCMEINERWCRSNCFYFLFFLGLFFQNMKFIYFQCFLRLYFIWSVAAGNLLPYLPFGRWTDNLNPFPNCLTALFLLPASARIHYFLANFMHVSLSFFFFFFFFFFLFFFFFFFFFLLYLLLLY